MTEQLDYFRTFCKISKAFGTVLSTEKLLDIIVESAIESMNAKAACLFLADEEKDIFVPVAQKGLSDNYLRPRFCFSSCCGCGGWMWPWAEFSPRTCSASW